jgi:hypothetical protein
MDLFILIPAILTYIREKNGVATKTKLLKILYLLDIEAYRESRSTLTGFGWKFYLYGPWAIEYEELLSDLDTSGVIALRAGTQTDLDTVFINSTESVPLAKAFPNVRQEFRARRIIDAWAERPTGELVDYVYFHTAPMRDAHRDDSLNFESVLTEELPPDYSRSKLQLDPKDIRRKRREFREALISAGRRRPVVPLDPPPKYDEQFWNAIEALDRDPD